MGLGITELDLAGSVTYLDAKTLATTGAASTSATADSPIGKRLPSVPEWRGTAQVTYRAVTPVSLSAAARYSSKRYTTLDNSDVNTNTYQRFGEWFVADARASVRLGQHWSGSLGADDLTNRKHFLFHPFPQRTLVSNLKFSF